MTRDRRPPPEDAAAPGETAGAEPCSGGAAAAGETMDPLATPEGRAKDGAPRGRRTRAAPGPGVPTSHEEYERLKDEARTRPLPRSRHAQADPGEET